MCCAGGVVSLLAQLLVSESVLDFKTLDDTNLGVDLVTSSELPSRESV